MPTPVFRNGTALQGSSEQGIYGVINPPRSLQRYVMVVVVLVVVLRRTDAPYLARLTVMHIVDFLENGYFNFFKLRTPVAHVPDYRSVDN